MRLKHEKVEDGWMWMLDGGHWWSGKKEVEETCEGLIDTRGREYSVVGNGAL